TRLTSSRSQSERKPLENLVGAAGIEPATTCSQSRYATAALRPAGCGIIPRTLIGKGHDEPRIHRLGLACAGPPDGAALLRTRGPPDDLVSDFEGALLPERRLRPRRG